MRLLITGILFLFFSFTLAAQSNYDCFNRFYNEGIKLYNQKKFDEANAQFKAAKICDHIPDKTDIDEWMTKAVECAMKTKEDAELEKKKAENDLKHAQESLAAAKQISFLSLAQKLATKSTQIINDPQTQGLLAMQAFLLNKENGGSDYDPTIYDALRTALLQLDGSANSLTSSLRLPRALFEKNNILYFADIEGTVIGWDLDRSSVSFNKI